MPFPAHRTMLVARSHVPLLHRAVHWPARATSSVSPYPHPSEEQSQSCAPSPSPAQSSWLLRSSVAAEVHMPSVGLFQAPSLGICGPGVSMLVVMNLTLFFVLCCSQIIQQLWFLQCSGRIKISRDFRHCPKKTGESNSSFLSLSCGRSCGLRNLLGSEFCQPQGGVIQANWHCSFYPFSMAGLTFCGSWSAGTSPLDSRALTKIFLSLDGCQISVSVEE